MVIVRLSGGVGNQMFQYAFAYSFSKIKTDKFLFDPSFFFEKHSRTIALEEFGVCAEFASVNFLNRIFPDKSNNFFTKIRNKILKAYYRFEIFYERSLLFDDNIHKVEYKNIYFDGYWQSEKYFKAFDRDLRRIFNFKKIENKHNKLLVQNIVDSNSISIHFRRGDYISDKKTSEIHGVCSHDYYLLAVDLIAKKTINPTFFIFSDDIDWVKNNFKIAYNHHFVDDKTNSVIADMYLMSLCKHNIIANSSYSWWGAWLNNNSDKIVVAPQKWFADVKKNDFNDIVPRSWIKI